MIVLDTNVVSELMRPVPEPGVVEWVDSFPVNQLATTSITVAEILYGVRRMPSGKRKKELQTIAELIISEDFDGRVLSFDTTAAVEYAVLVTERLNGGLPISMADAQIAAICMARGFDLATRNTADFSHLDLTLLNPWRR